MYPLSLDDVILDPRRIILYDMYVYLFVMWLMVDLLYIYASATAWFIILFIWALRA